MAWIAISARDGLFDRSSPGDFSPNKHTAKEPRIEVFDLSLVRALEHANPRGRAGACDDVSEPIVVTVPCCHPHPVRRWGQTNEWIEFAQLRTVGAAENPNQRSSSASLTHDDFRVP